MRGKFSKRREMIVSEPITRGTWEEFQKRCDLQHDTLDKAVAKLEDTTGRLERALATLAEGVSGTSWFRQVMTGLIALAIGVMYPQAIQALKHLFHL